MMPRILCGDVVEQLGKYGENVFDGCLCDPPYGLGFMGRNWDGVVPSSEVWKEVLRVLKPGAFLLAFGGTRTFHRLACAVEDAGFELRDTLMWVYGTGFPKSHDISKAIDKAVGAEREVLDRREQKGAKFKTAEAIMDNMGFNDPDRTHYNVTAPATESAQVWNGYGTALKPSYEPLILAQKPRDGTFANNALTWGCGGIWVDGCRIGTTKDVPASPSRTAGLSLSGSEDGTLRKETGDESGHNPNMGRWPANLLLQHTPECRCIGEQRVKGITGGKKPIDTQVSIGTFEEKEHRPFFDHADPDGKETIAAWECVEDCPVRILGEQSGELKSGTGAVKRDTSAGWQGSAYGQESREAGTPNVEYGDRGTCARFFYQAKASRSERNLGLDDFYWMRDKSSPVGFTRISQSEWEQLPKRQRAQGNIHPTVKPLGIIEYIAKLIMPPENRKLLVPFSGSGSEMLGALKVGWKHIVGIDIISEYNDINRARIRRYLESS